MFPARYFNRINFREINFRESLSREKPKIGHSRNSATFPIRESLSIKIATFFSYFFANFRFLASQVNFHENPLFFTKKNLKIFFIREILRLLIRES